jgi:hypothetical protein
MCTGCHQQISATEAKRQKVLKDNNGRIRALYHGKCWVRKRRQDWVGTATGKYYPDSPDAYEMAGRKQNADDLSPEAVEHKADVEKAWLEFTSNSSIDPEVLAQLAVRQAELAEERKKESSPQRHDDWRDPLEAEF